MSGRHYTPTGANDAVDPATAGGRTIAGFSVGILPRTGAPSPGRYRIDLIPAPVQAGASNN